MGTMLECIKPMSMSEGLNERDSRIWNVVTRNENNKLKQLLTDIYFRVLDHYQLTGYAVPMHVINKPFVKRYHAILIELGLPTVPLVNILKPAALSETLPLVITLLESGQYMLLPRAAQHTYSALQVRNSEGGKQEHLNEWTDICSGEAEGPALRGKGLIKAESPFDTAVVPKNVTIDEKLDTP